MKKLMNMFLVMLSIACIITASACRDGAGDSGKQLTLEDVIALSEKGQGLTWKDLEGFERGEEVGSGLYIVIYDIDDTYGLSVGGGLPGSDGPLMYAYLTDKTTGAYIDILKEDPEEFLKGSDK